MRRRVLLQKLLELDRQGVWAFTPATFSALLGHPAHNHHGDPIPAVDGTLEPDGSFPLAAAAVGQRVLIARVGHETIPMLTYLGEQRGLVPGRVLTIADEDGTTHSLGAPLADALFVRGASRYDAE